MSDSTRTTGRLDFVPPLEWQHYRDTIDEFYEHAKPQAGTSMLVIAESVDVVDTDQGQLTKRAALGVVPRHEDPWGKIRGLEEELDHLARIAWDAGSELTGALYSVSDHNGLGIQRWTIGHDRSRIGYPYTVDSTTALLVWPDGSAAHVPETTETTYGPPMTWTVLGTGDKLFIPITEGPR